MSRIWLCRMLKYAVSALEKNAERRSSMKKRKNFIVDNVLYSSINGGILETMMIPNPFKKKTVLIVEDDNVLRKVLSDKMNVEGWRAIEASNGRDGLVFALEKHPDVILLDLMLPEMDGISLLAELRKDEWGKDAKVIVMSNLIKGVGLMEKAEQYKVADYVEKADMSLDLIAEKIKKIM
jgi:CheY-like chemotaxis protein